MDTDTATGDLGIRTLREPLGPVRPVQPGGPVGPVGPDSQPAAARDREIQLRAPVDPADSLRLSTDVPGALAAASRVSAPRARAPEPTGGAGRLLAVEPVGDRVRILRVGRPAGLRFTAGQYLKLGHSGSKARKFSITSAPGETVLEFCVALNPGGSLTPMLFELGAGAQLDLAESASGSFGLDGSARHHLMVATGTGIAPIRSMIRDALAGGSGDTFTVLHGASHPGGLPYRAEFEQLADEVANVEYVPTVSRPADAAGSARNGAGRTGVRRTGAGLTEGGRAEGGLTSEVGRVERLATRYAAGVERASTCVYACGNAGMVANVRRHMQSCGLQVRTESYG